MKFKHKVIIISLVLVAIGRGFAIELMDRMKKVRKNESRR